MYIYECQLQIIGLGTSTLIPGVLSSHYTVLSTQRHQYTQCPCGFLILGRYKFSGSVTKCICVVPDTGVEKAAKSWNGELVNSRRRPVNEVQGKQVAAAALRTRNLVHVNAWYLVQQYDSVVS